MFEFSPAPAPSRTSSRRALVFLAAALCVCLASAGASAQAARTSVAGRVLNQNGAAVPGARVRLRQANTGVEFSAEADDAGAYRFEDLAPGAYALSASGHGFAAASQEVALAAGAASPPDVTRRPAGAAGGWPCA